MNLRNLTLAVLVLLTTVLFSCRDERDSSITGNGTEATFTAGISTRVSDVVWDINDAIGIVMLDHTGRVMSEDKFNTRYYTTTAAGNFQPTSPEDILYFPQNGDPVTFKAYYPYSSGLQRNLRIPVSVANQENLSAIDFMSAHHMTGFTKEEPNVILQFHHQLSKVIFKLNIAENVPDLLPEDITLTIQGMKTAGVYDLLNETLTVVEDSDADLILPVRGNPAERTGIVLPRTAGSGVIFNLTTEGGSSFTANMGDDLPLDPGYKYTFNITLQGTEMSVSVTIQDWLEGPTTSYDMLGINTPAGESHGVFAGDQMNVYIQNENDYDLLRTFTYGTDNKWTTDPPVFWDEISNDQINLRAALVPREAARNETQLPDILIATPLGVQRNHGADFIFNHAGSRVVVELQSTFFSAEELAAASLLLPNYFTGGREEKGVFIPGTTRQDVIIDRTDPTDQFAIIQPQAISAGAALIGIGIADKNFTANAPTDGFVFEAGVAYKLILTVNENGVSVSAQVIDWKITEPHYFDILGTSIPADESYGVVAGDQMTVFIQNGNQYDTLRVFTYGSDGTWAANSPIFWDEFEGEAINLKATLAAREEAKNATQIPDIIIATPLSVPRNEGANFVLNHAASRMVVELRSTFYSEGELNAATISLPNYMTGARELNGEFIPGNTRQNVIVDRSNPSDQFALIQPQPISPNAGLVTLGINGKSFTADTGTDGFNYEAGTAYKLILTVNENGISVSARVIDWQSTEPQYFDMLGVSTPAGESVGVVAGDQMNVFIQRGNDYELLTTFTFGNDGKWTPASPIYWDAIQTDAVNLRASLVPRESAKNETQIPDILVAAPLSVQKNQGAEFEFRHAGSRVVVQLNSTFFTAEQLQAATILLPNYFTGGSEATGVFTPGTTRQNVIIDRTNPDDQFAIIQPQAITANGALVTIQIAGRTITANAPAEGFTYQEGVAYKLILTANDNGMTASARIIDWENAEPNNFDMLGVSTPAGDSYGAVEGDEMNVYIQNGNSYDALRTFTYGNDGKWTTTSPLYWDEIPTTPINLRASITPREPAKNDTQIPDILIATPLNVDRNTPAEFVFNHAGSKVSVVLQSGFFTADELSAATILLPNYYTGGTEQNGAFVPGTTRQNVLIDRTDPDDQFAIIQPQNITANGDLVTVEIAGRTFTAKAPAGGLALEAGVAHRLVLTMNDNGISVSARVVDWENAEPNNFDLLGVSTPAGDSQGVTAGDQMKVFIQNGLDYDDLRTFTYGADGKWTTTPPVYWDEMPADQVNLRATLVAKESAKNETQIPDIMVASPLSVERNQPAEFVFTHVGSKVTVVLQSGYFTQAQMDAATILLPNYFIGGTEDKGIFTPGTTRRNVIVDRTDVNNSLAIIQPQSITANGSLVTVQIAGRSFTANAPATGYTYEAGVAYRLILTMNNNGMTVSARVTDWENADPSYFDMLGVTTPAGDSYGVVTGDAMNVYIQNGNDYDALRTYTYGSDGKWAATPPVFWDDILTDPINLRAALTPREGAKNSTQIPDILVATPLSVQRNSGADFVFNHAGSRVVVFLQSNVFTQEQLNGATITLPSYFTGGREEKGVFIPGTTRQNVLVDRTDPDDPFAIIQPQAISPNGALVTVTIGTRSFTATASADGFTYQAGVAYRLIVTVNESDVAVSARVIDWTPSGPHDLEILEVTPSLEDTEGVDVNAIMNVYKKEGAVYNGWATFTYQGNNRWTPNAAVYWNTIQDPSVELRASITAATKLHATQLDDILIADDINVPVGNGVDFTFRHVASKAVVRLISDTFTDAQLDGATITMPQYQSGGVEQNGQFIPGQALQDIILVKEATRRRASRAVSPTAQIALFQSQTITGGNNMFKVSIGTRDYWAKAPSGGFNFQPGVAYAITIHVNEENVTVSAQVIDWTANSFDLNAVTIGTELPGASSGINNGEQMNVYIASGADRTPLSTFTYSAGSDTWTSSPTLYWESITGTPAFYGSILRASRFNETQLDDYLIADPVTPQEGRAVNFTLRHPASKVIVQLRSSDGTFSTTDLQNMNITLPNYLMGGNFNNGLFEFPQPGQTGTVNVAVVDNNATAIIRPQTVMSGATVVNIHDPATNRNYPVIYAANIQFTAGVATTLVIDMKKTPVVLSATAIDWEEGSTIPLVPTAITIHGTLGQTADFFRDKTIQTYRLGGAYNPIAYTYEPVSAGSTSYYWQGETMYWDDMNGQPLNITGVYYPQQADVPNLGSGVTSFTWNIPSNQSSDYSRYDLLMSNVSLQQPGYVNFNFRHVLSKVRIKLVSNEFTATELQGANVLLNNFIINGSASLTTAAATGVNTRQNITPFTHTDGAEYSALVMPQTINANTSVVTITLPGYPNTPFTGSLSSNLVFVAGKENVITITLQKTKIELSATLEEWTAGSTGHITIQ